MDWLCRVSAQRYPAGMELSAELVACILYFVPLSPAKLAMQGVSRSFRKAMRTTQAHAGNTEVTFPLQASHPPCISRDILRVMPLVCLAPEQKDFSWVAFLEHLQELACEYGALQPVSPLQTMQKLTLDCIVSYKRHRQRFMYNKKISLDYLFPNLKQLYLHSIPQEDVVHGQQSEKHFLKDIQLMSLQCVVLDNYPYQCMPLLAQNPKWATLDISVNSMPFGNQMPLTESCVPASTADIVTSLHLQDIDIDSLDLNEFARCARLRTLTFRLWSHSEFFQNFMLFNLASLPTSCCTVKFLNFEPFMRLSELKGWHWGRSSGTIGWNLELTRLG